MVVVVDGKFSTPDLRATQSISTTAKKKERNSTPDRSVQVVVKWIVVVSESNTPVPVYPDTTTTAHTIFLQPPPSSLSSTVNLLCVNGPDRQKETDATDIRIIVITMRFVNANTRLVQNWRFPKTNQPSTKLLIICSEYIMYT